MSFLRSIVRTSALACALSGAALPQGASAVTTTYLATIGTADVPGSDTGHFDNPASVAIDTANNHLLVVDQANERVQIFDATTYAYVATLGTAGVPGSDNAHFYFPQGVGFDAPHGRILVADSENERVQIFNAATLAYVGTIGNGTQGSTNAAFNLPTGVAYDPAHNQILVVDQNNDRVQVFDGSSFAYVATIGQTGQSLRGQGVFSLPAGIAVDTVNNHILVADQNNNQLQILNTGSFSYVGVIGDSGGAAGTGNAQFNALSGVGFDSANHEILVADFDNDRVQIFDAASLAYLGTIGQAGAPGSGNASLDGPASVAVNPANGQILVADAVNQRVQVYSQSNLPNSVVAAILPGSRSVEIGTTATVFGVMLNASTASLSNCRIGLGSSAPAGLTMGYQTTSASNTLTGTPNTPVTIPGNSGAQNFLLTFQSTAAFSVTGLPLAFTCDGSAPAPATLGVNTIDLLFSATPVADIIALAATSSDNGIVTVPYSTGGGTAFAVATVDAGAAGTVTVEVDTGAATLPLTFGACATNPSTGACLAPPATSFQQSYQASGTQTYSIFLSANAPIAFAPGTARLFLRFRDAAGASHGSTSVAVQTD